MTRRRAQTTVRWILIAATAVAAIAAAGFGILRYARPVLVVTEAVNGPVVQAFYSTGTIQPEREFPIKSNTAGILGEVRVDKGARVKKDEVLAVVADPQLRYLLEKAQAELDEKLKRADDRASPVLAEFDSKIGANHDMLALAQGEETRLKDAMAFNGASRTALDAASEHAKAVWSEGEALKSQRAAKKLELDREVQVARSAVSIAQWNFDQQTLRSPIDGVVLDRPTALRTRLAVNDVLMRVADVTPANLVMRAAVDEEDVAKVTVGQTVKLTLYAFADAVFTGTVQKIYDQADPDRRTFEIDVRLTSPNDRLSPGMTGELAFIMASKESAIVVPSQSLQGGSVYVVRDGQLQKLADAKIGLKSVERLEIVSGMNVGDRVVISPVGSLPDGQRVRTQYMDPSAAAGINKPAVAAGSFKGFN